MGLTALKIEDLPQYTYQDYAQWEGRWELINGIPYAMVPMPRIKHQRVCGKIYNYLSELLDARTTLTPNSGKMCFPPGPHFAMNVQTHCMRLLFEMRNMIERFNRLDSFFTQKRAFRDPRNTRKDAKGSTCR